MIYRSVVCRARYAFRCSPFRIYYSSLEGQMTKSDVQGKKPGPKKLSTLLQACAPQVFRVVAACVVELMTSDTQLPRASRARNLDHASSAANPYSDKTQSASAGSQIFEHRSLSKRQKELTNSPLVISADPISRTPVSALPTNAYTAFQPAA